MNFGYTVLDSSDDFVRAVESTMQLFEDAFREELIGQLTIENSINEEKHLIRTQFCYTDAADRETDWYIESMVPQHTFQTDIAAKRRLVCCHVFHAMKRITGKVPTRQDRAYLPGNGTFRRRNDNKTARRLSDECKQSIVYYRSRGQRTTVFGNRCESYQYLYRDTILSDALLVLLVSVGTIAERSYADSIIP